MKRRITTLLAVAVIVLGVAVFASGSEPVGERLPAKAIERPDGPFNYAAWATQMRHLQERLDADRVEEGLLRPLEVRVHREMIREIEEGTRREQKIRVGIAQPVMARVDFSDLAPGSMRGTMDRPFGAVRGTDSGFVWTGVVRAVGAAATRVHIEEMDLPEGAELYAYTRDGMAFGPYVGRGPNGTGDFWTNTVDGPEVILQIHHESFDGRTPAFRISEVGHVTHRFPLAGSLRPMSANTKPCSFNANCVEDVACVNENAAVNTAKDAVADMIFASGAYLYLCSGGLVADSDTGSTVPYFVTANHCISKGREAASLETFFFYRASQCQQCPDRGSPSTNGATILSSNRTSDYTLMQLSQSAPSGAAYLGWNSNPIAFTNGANLYRVSHPGGAPQAYSEHVVDTSKGTCTSWPRGNWIYSRDVFGATEGGSSGSPVVNAAGELVGQLSGACGFNVNDVCDSASNATVDGAFAAYYNQVSGWLGSGGGGPTPEDCSDGVDNDGDGLADCDDGDCASDPSCNTGGCTDADGDGWCVEDGDCNDNDKNVYPGHNDSKGRWGRDGVDNDCDGVIDG